MEVKRNDIALDQQNKIKLQLPVAIDNYFFSGKKAEQSSSQELAEYKKLKVELIQKLSVGKDISGNCQSLVSLFKIESDAKRLELNLKEIYSELKVHNSTLLEKCSHGLEKAKVAAIKLKEWGNIFVGAMTYHCWDKEKGIAYINKTIEAAQNSEHGSILGTKEEFFSKRYENKSLKEMFLDKEFWNESFSLVGVNHALNVVVEPVLTPVEELGKEFTQRVAWVGYNALQTALGESRLNYEQFLIGIEEGNNSQLNIIKGSIEALEAFGIAYCMVASGGAGAASKLSRLSRLQKFASNSKDALKLLFLSPTSPVLMSFLGVLGQVLQDKNVRSVNSSEFAGNVFKATLRDTSQNMHFMGFLSALSRASVVTQSFFIRKKAQQEIDALVACSAGKEVISLRYDKFAKDTEKAVLLTQTLMEGSDAVEGFPDFISALHNVSNKGLNLLYEPNAENKRYFLGSLCQLSSSFIDLVDFKHSGEKERSAKYAKRDLTLKDKKSVHSLWDSIEGDKKRSPIAFYDKRNDVRVTTSVSANQSIEEKAASLYFTLHEDMHRIIAKTEGGLNEILLSKNYNQATEVIKIKNILTDYLGINYQEILTFGNKLAKEQLEELVCYLFATEELSSWAKRSNLKIQLQIGFASISFAESETTFQAGANLYSKLHLFVQSAYSRPNSNPELLAADEPDNSKEQNVYEQLEFLSNLGSNDVMDSFIEASTKFSFDEQDILFTLSAAGRNLLIMDADSDKIYTRLKLLCRTAEALGISNESLVGATLQQIYYSNGQSDKLSSEIKEREVLIRARTLVQIAGVNEKIFDEVMSLVLCQYLSLFSLDNFYEEEKNFIAARIWDLRQREYFPMQVYDQAIRIAVVGNSCSSSIGNLYRFIFSESNLEQNSITLEEFKKDLVKGLKIWFVRETNFQLDSEILDRLEKIVDPIGLKIILQKARSLACIDLLNNYSQSRNLNSLLRALMLAEFSVNLLSGQADKQKLEEVCSKAIGQYLLVSMVAKEEVSYSTTLIDTVIERFCPAQAKKVVIAAITEVLTQSFSFNSPGNIGLKNKQKISDIISELIQQYQINSQELIELGVQIIKTVARELDTKVYQDNTLKVSQLLDSVAELLGIRNQIWTVLGSCIQAEHHLAKFKFLLLSGDIDRVQSCYFEARDSDYPINEMIIEDKAAVTASIKIFLGKEFSRIKGVRGVTGEYQFLWNDAWNNIKKLILLLDESNLIALFQEAIKDPLIQSQLMEATTVQVYSAERNNAICLACLNVESELLGTLINDSRDYYLVKSVNETIDQAEERALVEALNEGRSIKVQEIISCFEIEEQRLRKIAKKVLKRAFYLGIVYADHISDLVQKYQILRVEVIECAAQAIARLEKKRINNKRIGKIVRAVEKLYLDNLGTSKKYIKKELTEKLIIVLLSDKKAIIRKIKSIQKFCETYHLSATEFNKSLLQSIVNFAENGNENTALVVLENWQERILVQDFLIAAIAHRRPLNHLRFILTICNLFFSDQAQIWNIFANAFAARIALARAELSEGDLEFAQNLAKQLAIPDFINQAKKRALGEIVKSNNLGMDSPKVLSRQLRMGAKLSEEAEGDRQIDPQYLGHLRHEIMKIVSIILLLDIDEQTEWLEYLNELVKITRCHNSLIAGAIATEVGGSLPAYLDERVKKREAIATTNLSESGLRQLQKFQFDQFVIKITAIIAELKKINQELSCKVAEGIIAGVIEKIGNADLAVEVRERATLFIDQLVEMVALGDREAIHQIRASAVICGGVRAVILNPRANLEQIEKNVFDYGVPLEEDKEYFYRELLNRILKSEGKLEKITEVMEYLTEKIPQGEIARLLIDVSLEIASEQSFSKERKCLVLNRLFNLAGTFAPDERIKERALYYILCRRTLNFKSKISDIDSKDPTITLQIKLLILEEQTFFKHLKFTCCSNSEWQSIVSSAQILLLFQTLNFDFIEILKELLPSDQRKRAFEVAEQTINAIVFDLIEDRRIEEGEYVGNLLFQLRVLHEKDPLLYEICKRVLEKVVNYLDRQGRGFEAQDIRAEINSIEQKFNEEYDRISAAVDQILNFSADYQSLEVLRNEAGWHVFDYLLCRKALDQIYISSRTGEDALFPLQLFCYQQGWAVAEAIENIRNKELDTVIEFGHALLELVQERKYADLINLIEETTGLPRIEANSFLAAIIPRIICELTTAYRRNEAGDAFFVIYTLLNSKTIVCAFSANNVPHEIYSLMAIVDLKLQNSKDLSLRNVKTAVLKIWPQFDPKEYRKYLRRIYIQTFFVSDLKQLGRVEKVLNPEGNQKERIGINIFIKALIANRTQALLSAAKYFKLSDKQVCQIIVGQVVKALDEKKYEEAVRLAKLSSFFGLAQDEVAKAIIITFLLNNYLSQKKLDNFSEQLEIYFDLYGFSRIKSQQIMQLIAEDLFSMAEQNDGFEKFLQQLFPSAVGVTEVVKDTLLTVEEKAVTADPNIIESSSKKLLNICRQLLADDDWSDQTQDALDQLVNFLDLIETTDLYKNGERPIFTREDVFQAAIDAQVNLILYAEPGIAKRLAKLFFNEENPMEIASLKAVTNLIMGNKSELAQQIAEITFVEDKFRICSYDAVCRLISNPIDGVRTPAGIRKEVKRRLSRIKQIVKTFEIENPDSLIIQGLGECLLEANGPGQLQALEVLSCIYANNSFSMLVNNLSIREFTEYFVGDTLLKINPKAPVIRKLRIICNFVQRTNQGGDLVSEAFSKELSIYYKKQDLETVRKIIYAIPSREGVKRLLVSVLSKKEEGFKNVELAKLIIDYSRLSNEEVESCLIDGYAQYVANNGLMTSYKLYLFEEFKRLEINNAEFSKETLKLAIKIRLEKRTESATEQSPVFWQETLSLINFYIGAYGKLQVLEGGNEAIRENIIEFLVEALRASMPIDQTGRNIEEVFSSKVGSTLEVLGLNAAQQNSICQEVIERFLVNINLWQLMNEGNVSLLRRSLRKVARIIACEDADNAMSALYEGVEDATPEIIKRLPLSFQTRDERKIYQALSKIGKIDADSYNNLTMEALIQLLMDEEWGRAKAILNRRLNRKEKKLENKNLARLEQGEFVVDTLTQCALRYFDGETSVKKVVADFTKLFDKINDQFGVELNVNILLSEILYYCSADILYSNPGGLEDQDLNKNWRLLEAKIFHEELCRCFGLTPRQKDRMVHELVLRLISEENNPTTVGKLVSVFYPGHYLSLIGTVWEQIRGYDIYIFNLLEELFYLGKKDYYRGAIALMEELKILYGAKNPQLLKMFDAARLLARSGLIGKNIKQGEDFESGEDDAPDGGREDGGGGGGDPSLLPKIPTGGGISVKKVPEPSKENEDSGHEQRVIMPPVVDRQDKRPDSQN